MILFPLNWRSDSFDPRETISQESERHFINDNQLYISILNCLDLIDVNQQYAFVVGVTIHNYRGRIRSSPRIRQLYIIIISYITLGKQYKYIILLYF